MRELRDAHPASEAVAAAEAVASHAASFADERARRAGLTPETTPIALYAALPGELDCFPLLERLAGQGFPTLLPVAGAKATPLRFLKWRPGDLLVAGRFGLREPDPSAPALTPRIVLAPLLAFDARGGRLGFGGGYYDATLAQLRAGGPVMAGGLAYSFQKIDEIPLEPHDARLDFVITEDGLLDFQADR
jgi:5-formyltetrahydrofolate cyclo-ligase